MKVRMNAVEVDVYAAPPRTGYELLWWYEAVVLLQQQIVTRHVRQGLRTPCTLVDYLWIHIRYNHSDKGRVRQYRYDHSNKGRVRRRRANATRCAARANAR
jgi:hypothetical protein